jgi:type I restriction-modification system DNA methylase subunit
MHVSDSAAIPATIASEDDLGDLLLEVLPGDGSTIGNQSAREALNQAAERPISDEEYEAIIGFKHDEALQGDPIGKIYETFLGQFALAEGKKGGEFLTPPSGVKLLVAVLAPHKGRVYDPCCGSGGMFVSSEEFVQSHGGRIDDISIYGQESNPTTWRLAAMNLAIRGFAADLGQEPADTFARDQFPDLKFDYIKANPPFNISDWGGGKYDNDPRWVYGRPPAGNANTAWLQHILWKLKPDGQAGLRLVPVQGQDKAWARSPGRNALHRHPPAGHDDQPHQPGADPGRH